jgi:hypothetical protein
MLFNGANVGEILTVSPNGGRVLFTRNIATVVMDLNAVENLEFNALGGADNFTVNNLAGTDLTGITVNLASTPGGSTGDAQPDVITVNGTNNPDNISLTADAGAVQVSGLPSIVRITTPEVALDSLIVNGLGGADVFAVGPGVTTLMGVTTNQ